MKIAPEAFEVLQTLGYPVYVRRSILKAEQDESVASVQLKPKKLYSSSPEEVKIRAAQVSARSNKLNTAAQQPASIKWPDFHLAISGVPGEVLVLFDIPDRTELQGSVTKKLIEKMLVKCGVVYKTSFYKEFHWPLFSRNKIDQSVSVAAKAFASLVHREQIFYSCKWILIFGDNAVSCTVNSKFDEVLGKSMEYLGAPAIVSFSVEELLLNTALRKTTWQHLLPLRNALQKQ